MPWEGYNFEDAVLVSERLVFDDVYIHSRARYEVSTARLREGQEYLQSKLRRTNIWKLGVIQ